MSTTKDFQVAIIGGGMCGLSCAIALANQGIEVDIFEATPQFGQVGAGVGLGINAIRALEGLGILPYILEKTDTKAPTLRTFVFVSGSGDHGVIYDSSKDVAEYGLAIYRPAFLEALLPLIEPKSLHLNKRCNLITRLATGRYKLSFEDGTTHETDIVIGADGVKSSVRSHITNNSSTGNLAFTNTFTYRGLVPKDILKKAGITTEIGGMPLCWMGVNKHIITYPIHGSDMTNIVLFFCDHSKPVGPPLEGPWAENVPHSEIQEIFNDWGRDARIIIDHMENPSRWSIHFLEPPLKSYVNGKVVLVGDAAHAMLPHLGAGVGQGFEDVYTLYRLLAHPKTRLANLESILEVYDELRPKRAEMVVQASTRAGEIYDSFGLPGHDVAWAQENLRGIWDFVWNHNLEQEIDRALVGQDGESKARL